VSCLYRGQWSMVWIHSAGDGGGHATRRMVQHRRPWVSRH
jgi:hypothetical protein